MRRPSLALLAKSAFPSNPDVDLGAFVAQARDLQEQRKVDYVMFNKGWGKVLFLISGENFDFVLDLANLEKESLSSFLLEITSL